MRTFEERLEHFGQAAAEALDGLMALAVSTPEAYAVTTQAWLRRYADQMQHIGHLAGDDELPGLQAACALVETNLLLLEDERRALSDSEIALLQGWPMLLLGYVANRADAESSRALVQNLSSAWMLTLPEESANEQMQMLVRPEAEPAPAAPEAPSLPEPPVSASPAPEPPTPEPSFLEPSPLQPLAIPTTLTMAPWGAAMPQVAIEEPPAASFEPAPTPSMPEAAIAEPVFAIPELLPAFDQPAAVQPAIEEAQPVFAQPAAVISEPQPVANAFGAPPSEAQAVEREMLAILAKELKELDDDFSAGLAAAAQGSEDERLVALGNLLDFMERVRMTVEAVGLATLAAWFTQVSWQLASLAAGIERKHHELLLQLPERMRAYLAAPGDEQACAGLAALLADEAWPSPLPPAEALAWQAALGNVQVTEGAPLTPARPTQAEPEDVSLDLPSDVNSELLEGLLQELPVQVSAFTSAITRITGGRGGADDAKQAMRAAHTLKGAANTVGVRGIANLTHHLEDILSALIEAEAMPQGELSAVLIHAGDCLETMSEFLLGLGSAPDNAQDVLQQVLDCANRVDHEGVSGAVTAETAAALPAAAESPVGTESLEATENRAGAEMQERRQAPSPAAAGEHALRVPAPLVDELLRLAGESLISNSQLQDHLRTTITQNDALRKQHRQFQQLLAELEHLVDIRGITSTQMAAGHTGGEFDTLEFEHYNELQTIGRQLHEAATDAQEIADDAETQLAALEELLEDQQRLQMSNQHALLRTRMVPVSSMVPRLQRSVRQTGRLLDKEVDFIVKGEHTTLDSNVLNDLMDPLMHMLRNSVDHGIENPEARRAAGKPAQGRIELSFAREGNSIVVRCRDDGAGLDYATIRRIAESKGLIQPGHVHSNDEIARMILAPGFSTREEASQVSGRGVGMDVVYSRVQAMKGMLSLDSRQGHGLTIELRLPATLLSTHALIIRQREKFLAVSTRGIEDIRYVTRDQFLDIGERQFFRDGEKLYALLKLENLLAMPHDRRAKDRQGFPVLLTRLGDGTERAVLVQEILESREVVMKKFGRYVPQVQGVAGAVILGDGGVAPVVDLVELLLSPVQQLLAAQREGAATFGAPEKRPLRALVVDDSLSARRAVVQVLKDSNLEVRTANDGLDAVTILEKWVPDIIISDMEMPRMNGLELASNVRLAERTKHVPIIMVTSRSTAKHRQMSEAAGVNAHIVKPFNDDDLVQQVLKLAGKQP